MQQFIYDYYDCCNKTVPQVDNYLGLFWKPTLINAWNIGKPLTCMSGVQQDFTKYYIKFSRFKSLMNNFLSLYNGNRVDTKISIDTVTGSDFAYMLEQENTSPVPKNKEMFVFNYKSDPLAKSYSNVYSVGIWQEPERKTGVSDLYVYPYYQDENGNRAYTNYQYHIYWGDNDDSNSDIALYIDVYNFTNGFGWILDSDHSGIAFEYTTSTKSFCFGFCPPSGDSKSCKFYFYSSYSDYTLNKSSSRDYSYYGFISVRNYYFDDGTLIEPIMSTVWMSDSDSLLDFGFYCCTDQITREYSSIDTSKIPDNYYVTVSGDTIYDYSITNPDTGQSDTINNYVTNNYTYTTNNNYGGGDGFSSGSSGGSVDGSITVDGRVDVGGTVSVDVNVNVNGGAASGGGVDYGDINTDPLDDYLYSALDDSSGIRQFMGDFFGFMPAELVVLLGIGLTFVIIGRIMGR